MAEQAVYNTMKALLMASEAEVSQEMYINSKLTSDQLFQLYDEVFQWKTEHHEEIDRVTLECVDYNLFNLGAAIATVMLELTNKGN